MMAQLASDNFDAGGDANPMPAPWYNARKYSSNFYWRTSTHAAPTGYDNTAQNYWDNSEGWLAIPDQYSECRVYTTGTVGSGSTEGSGFGPSVRNVNDPSYARQYRLLVDHGASNNVCIEKRLEVEGSDPITILGRTNYSWSDGALWRLEISGYALRAYCDGSLVLEASDGGSSLANGYPGICYGMGSGVEPDGYVDNWAAGSTEAAQTIEVVVGEPTIAGFTF